MEGSDTESRRKVSQELLRAMCRQFEAETTSICNEHMASMLESFKRDPAGQWKQKDAAVSGFEWDIYACGGSNFPLCNCGQH